MINGQPVQTGGDYYLRYVEDGKRAFRRVGPELSAALAAQVRMVKALDAEAAGVQIVRPEAPPKGDTLGERAADYLKYLEVSERAKNTIQDRVNLLDELTQHLGADKQMGEITSGDLLGWAHALRNKTAMVGDTTVRLVADSTTWYKLRKVRTFLLYFGRDILKRKDFPRYDETKPDTYTPEELQQFFGACDDDQRFWYSLLFGTGMRRSELANLQWPQVNLRQGLILIQSSADWKTKTRRARHVPIPAHLVTELQRRRVEHPDHVYVIGDGQKPVTELLYYLKNIAYSAGLNCGRCRTKTGHSCADGPHCKKFTVQKLRRSYVTHLHEGGTSINTLRTLLGHTSAAPIMRYLAHPDVQSPVLLANLNATFGRMTNPVTDAAPPA